MACLRHTLIPLFVISILGSASALSIASKKHLQRGDFQVPITPELIEKAKETCGYPHAMSDGSQVVDMPEGSVSNCTATRAFLQFFIDNWEEIGPKKMDEYLVAVGTWVYMAPHFAWEWSACNPTAPARNFSGRVTSTCILHPDPFQLLYDHELLGETVDERTVANLFNALLLVGNTAQDKCKQSSMVSSAAECREFFDYSKAADYMQLMIGRPKITSYWLHQAMDTMQGCGVAQTLPDGRKIVDMPYGTPSTCKGTFDVLQLLNDKFEEIGDEKLASWFDALKEMSDPKSTIKSLEALWDMLPKSPSGMVSTDAFLPRIGLETAFPISFSQTDLSNYVHAMLQIGYAAGVIDMNKNAEWSGIFKPTHPISWPVTNRTVLKTLTHGCGFPQIKADGSVVVDMLLGSPSTCKGTYDIVRSISDNYENIGDAKLTEWLYGVKELSEKYESFEALWEKLPRSSSGEVLCDDVKTYTGASFASTEPGTTMDFLAASNYIHAMLEIGGEAGILEPYAIAEWAGTLKPMSSKMAPSVQLTQQKV